MNKQQQINKIRKALIQRGSITTNSALFRYRPPIKRLGARIWDLRKMGMNIQTIIRMDGTAKYVNKISKGKIINRKTGRK